MPVESRAARRLAMDAAREAECTARQIARASLLILYIRFAQQSGAALRFAWAHAAGLVLPRDLLLRILAFAD